MIFLKSQQVVGKVKSGLYSYLTVLVWTWVGFVSRFTALWHDLRFCVQSIS